LLEICANKGTLFISYTLDSKEDKIKKEEGKDKDALFIKEGKQKEEAREGLILFELSYRVAKYIIEVYLHPPSRFTGVKGYSSCFF